MGKFVKGDIVIVPFPFSDLSNSKRRPALVLVDFKGNDLILCQITSQTVSDEMSVFIDIADENIVLYQIGRLTQNKLNDVVVKVVDMLQN